MFTIISVVLTIYVNSHLTISMCGQQGTEKKLKGAIDMTGRLSSPGEPKRSGHVTIAQKVSASTFRVFRTFRRSRSDKKCFEMLCQTFLAYSQNS